MKRRYLTQLMFFISVCVALLMVSCNQPAGQDSSTFRNDFSIGLPSEDLCHNMFVFERKDQYQAISPVYYSQDGCYIECYFNVKGSNIKEVTVSTSFGILHRYTYEYVDKIDEPEKHLEAVSWKPTVRGTGKYFSQYDDVEIAPRPLESNYPPIHRHASFFKEAW